MDKKIHKLRILIKNHFNQSKAELESIYGDALIKNDDDVWCYSKKKWWIFREEIVFIFDNDNIFDIVLTDYILGVEYQNLFYYKGEEPEYKRFNLFKYNEY